MEKTFWYIAVSYALVLGSIITLRLTTAMRLARAQRKTEALHG